MRRIQIEEPQAAHVTVAQTLLRVILGAVMLAHGWLKVLHYEDWQRQVTGLGFPSPDLLAALALAGELLGGLGLIFGLLTRVAAVGVLSMRVAAIVTVHLKHGLLSQNGGFEYPLLLAVVAMYFLIVGPGPFSLDSVLRRRARRRAIERDPIWQHPPYSTPPHRR
jgi:putative oxidoreductase